MVTLWNDVMQTHSTQYVHQPLKSVRCETSISMNSVEQQVTAKYGKHIYMALKSSIPDSYLHKNAKLSKIAIAFYFRHSHITINS